MEIKKIKQKNIFIDLKKFKVSDTWLYLECWSRK